MKHQKKKKQDKNQQINKNKPQQKILESQQTFFEKFIAPYSIWFFIGFVLIIGFIALGKYLTSEYLFFFKDINFAGF